MKNNKLLLTLSIIAALMLGCVTGVVASNGSTTKELFYRDIKITLNGEEIIPKDANGNAVEPFIIDGTTYLPVRGVASALDLDVGWDGSTNTVVLSDVKKTDSQDASDKVRAVYPITIKEEYTAIAKPLPEIVYSTTAEENGLDGNIYYLNGTVIGIQEAFSAQSFPCFFVNTKLGNVTIIDMYNYAKEAYSDSFFLFEEPESDYSFPKLGEDVIVYGIYAGYSDVFHGPALYYGASKIALASLIPPSTNDTSDQNSTSEDDTRSNDINDRENTSPAENRIVYVTKTGKKYHYDNHCNGGTYTATTLENALSRGLTPCNKCVK